MSVLALIPARSGSKGCVGKNLRKLGGKTLIEHAVECGWDAGCDQVVLSTDMSYVWRFWFGVDQIGRSPYRERRLLHRPAELAQDDTPMIAVVQHALREIPGPPDQIVVLLQPTQPFRTVAHIQRAIALLRESGADSVVSVVDLPLTYASEFQCRIKNSDGRLIPRGDLPYWDCVPTRRQDVDTPYRRDGTLYMFRRSVVGTHGTLYGKLCMPLIINPEDTCELDTESDWLEVERRWKERHG